jgi:prenyl protein peptidase
MGDRESVPVCRRVHTHTFDAPLAQVQVRARMAVLVPVCALAPVPAIVAGYMKDGRLPWQQLGLAPGCNTPSVLLHALALFVVLFAGPIGQFLRDMWVLLASSAPLHRWTNFASAVKGGLPSGSLHRLLVARTLVVAPLTEEWVFRCCVVAVLAQAGFTARGMMAVTALVFGVAHLHHFIELRRRGATRAQAALSLAFQLSFTSLFGGLGAYVFIRTGSLGSVVLAHAFCNWMGAPHLGWAVDPRLALGSRVLLAAAFVGGVAGFAHQLQPWTQPATHGCSIG